MHPIRPVLLCAFVGALLAQGASTGCARDAKPPAGQASKADVYLKPDTEEVTGTVPPNSTLASLFRAHLPGQHAAAAVQLVTRCFDPRKLRAHQQFTLTRTLDGWLRHFEYQIDLDRYLRVAPATPIAPGDLTAEVITYKRQELVTTATGAITRDSPSLFQAMKAAGETDDLAVELAAVFSGEIDFNSELQPGDSFRLAFQKVIRETGTVSYGNILSAAFSNGGRQLNAFRFVLPDGKFGFYDENGRSLRRFFLKSPLKFEPRVTSGFSYNRRHPILNVTRAHLGVDYAAPVGAPVVAVSNGVVTKAGFAGAAGRLVSIRHSGGYESLYLHLSSFGVRVGQHVSQGEVVGRVGSSGLSTGPHLDYRLRKNGGYVNPILEHRRMPPGEPIPAGVMAAFMAERDRVAGLLPPAVGSVVAASPLRSPESTAASKPSAPPGQTPARSGGQQ